MYSYSEESSLIIISRNITEFFLLYCHIHESSFTDDKYNLASYKNILKIYEMMQGFRRRLVNTSNGEKMKKENKLVGRFEKRRPTTTANFINPHLRIKRPFG